MGVCSPLSPLTAGECPHLHEELNSDSANYMDLSVKYSDLQLIHAVLDVGWLPAFSLSWVLSAILCIHSVFYLSVLPFILAFYLLM